MSDALPPFASRLERAYPKSLQSFIEDDLDTQKRLAEPEEAPGRRHLCDKIKG